jgi:hypothetical protein
MDPAAIQAQLQGWDAKHKQETPRFPQQRERAAPYIASLLSTSLASAHERHAKTTICCKYATCCGYNQPNLTITSLKRSRNLGMAFLLDDCANTLSKTKHHTQQPWAKLPVRMFIIV